MHFIKQFKLPDYISFIALFFAWISIVLLLQGKPNWAIVVNMWAFASDVIDGYLARKIKKTFDLGRHIDSFADIFTYVVFSCLLFYLYISPNFITGLVLSFAILLFGGLRLIRYNLEGILNDKHREYYRGVTVVHLNFSIIIAYFLQSFFSFWNPWFTVIILLIISPFMLSNYKSYKIKRMSFFVFIILIFTALSLLLEYGNKK